MCLDVSIYIQMSRCIHGYSVVPYVQAVYTYPFVPDMSELLPICELSIYMHS